MQKIYKKIIIILVLTIVALSNFYFTSVCLASTNSEIQAQLNHAAAFSWGSIPDGSSSLSGIVATVIQAFLGLLGIIFLVLILYAGYQWMTAQGEEEKVTKAKDTLQRAVIGLIIIIAAYSITYFVFSSLSGGDGEGVQSQGNGQGQ